MMTQPTLRTERLVLRPFRLEDGARVEQLAGDRLVADTTLNIPHPYPAGAAAPWIASHAPAWMEGTHASFAVTAEAEGGLVGAVALTISAEHARAELGYWVGVPFWNRGYCTEASRAMLAFAFEKLGLHRLQARHLVRNPASGRVMQKLGMQFEGINRGHFRKWDQFEDIAMYAILESDPRND
jgi:ribosomal-protein-alanine N-acetyltransferase